MAVNHEKILLKNNYKLFPYQQEVILWMKHREQLTKKSNREKGEKIWGIRGGIISLCMGLGKTLTALAYSFQNKASFELFWDVCFHFF